MATLCVRNAVRRLSDGQRTFELSIRALSLAPGDRKAIIGPSGSGKTTAMDLIALASTPDECESLGILADEGQWIDLAKKTPETLARIRAGAFGYVLQTASLLPFLTIGENITLPQRLTKRVDAAFVQELLSVLDIHVPLATMPADLSVGQRQRVSIARALAHRPAFLLADEPTAALDPASASRAMNLMLSLAAAQGTSVLVISHDRTLIEAHDLKVVPVRFFVENGRCFSEIDDGTWGASCSERNSA